MASNPGLAAPPRAPMRAALAALLVRLVAARVPIQIVTGRQPGPAAPGRPVLRVHRPADLYRRVGAGGLIGLGEAYQAGDWDADDLAGLLTAAAAAMRAGRLAGLRRAARLRHVPWLRPLHGGASPAAEENTVAGARENIHRHYDLSNEMFALFLDESMTYSSALFDSGPPVAASSVAVPSSAVPSSAVPSSAVPSSAVPSSAVPSSAASFESAGADLAAAQRRKIDRLLDGTAVRDGSRVLEIGTGWGELAVRAARRGARVHTITISAEQHDLARQRVAEAGVADRVTVELRDYRELAAGDGYDAVLSVEMVEAVGERFWPVWFGTLDRMLAPGGRAGIQAILVPDERLRDGGTHTWIQKYIFPGGVMLSGAEVERRVAAGTALRVADRFAFGAHYARTLRLWRERFDARADAVAALGFDETFRRTWDYYLAYCEAGFAAGELDVEQIILERRPS